MRRTRDSRLCGSSVGAFRLRKTAAQTAFGIVGLTAVIFMTGCASIRSIFRPSPAPDAWSVKTSGGSSVTTKGGAESPAKLIETRAVSSLPVAAGSTVEVRGASAGSSGSSVPGPTQLVTLSAPSVLTVESSGTVAESPRSFTPPAPPTPAEIATGKGVRLFYWLAAAFAVAAVASFYTGHFKAGVICAVSAGGLPLLASTSVWLAEHAAVAAGCVAASLVGAWFLLRSKLKDTAEESEK
jgi:hypothetical protein